MAFDGSRAYNVAIMNTMVIYDACMGIGNRIQPGRIDFKWLKAQRVSLLVGTLRGNTASQHESDENAGSRLSSKQYGDRYMIDFGQNMAGWVRY